MIFRKMSEEEIHHWYRCEMQEAFLPNEIKPLEDILSMVEAGTYEIYGLFENGAEADESHYNLLGYATLWKKPGVPLVLLDYLGVNAEKRNAGIGGKILGFLKERESCLVLESEIPVPGDPEDENDIRRRRIEFYKRNGFTPAYIMATCGLKWQAMLHQVREHAPEDIMRWHKELYGEGRTDVIVPISQDMEAPLPYWMKRG